MKKILLVLLVFLVLISGCTKKKEKKLNIGLMDFEEYKEIDVSKVTSMDYIRYTEGGREDETYTDSEDILRFYNSLKRKTIIGKTEMACEDNTKIFIFKTEDKEYKIEVECEILIYNKDRYVLE